MNRVKTTVFILAVVLLASCATQPNEQEMDYLASALTKVSAAVDATVRYRRLPENMSESELLRAATAHDNQLMKPFDGFTVRVLRSGRDSAVLVCQPRGRALLEDAGCTAKLDVHRWNAPGGNDLCEFTLDLNTVCAR
jgi:outer membrane murein-binding lipoprotein Lpp